MRAIDTGYELINGQIIFSNGGEIAGTGGGGGSSAGTPITNVPTQPTHITTASIQGPLDAHPSIPVNPPVIGTTTPAPATRPVRKLSDGVTVDKKTISRRYVKGTHSVLPYEIITLTNAFTDLDVNVSFATPNGISLNPNSFTLARGRTQDVAVQFNDPYAFEPLPDGISQLTFAINLSSVVPTYVPLPDPVIHRTDTTPSIPVSPPIIGFPPTPTPIPVPITPPTHPTPVPVVPTTIQVWTNGIDGSVGYGFPPAGWVQNPDSGAWFPPIFPYVFTPTPTPVTPPTPVIPVSPPRPIAPAPTDPTTFYPTDIGTGFVNQRKFFLDKSNLFE